MSIYVAVAVYTYTISWHVADKGRWLVTKWVQLLAVLAPRRTAQMNFVTTRDRGCRTSERTRKYSEAWVSLHASVKRIQVHVLDMARLSKVV